MSEKYKWGKTTHDHVVKASEPTIDEMIEWFDTITEYLHDNLKYKAIRAILEQHRERKRIADRLIERVRYEAKAPDGIEEMFSMIRGRCEAIALDVYDLSVANGSINARSQREIAQGITSRLKQIWDALPPIPKDELDEPVTIES